MSHGFLYLLWFGSSQFYPYISGLLHCDQGNHTIASDWLCASGAALENMGK